MTFEISEWHDEDFFDPSIGGYDFFHTKYDSDITVDTQALSFPFLS